MASPCRKMQRDGLLAWSSPRSDSARDWPGQAAFTWNCTRLPPGGDRAAGQHDSGDDAMQAMHRHSAIVTLDPMSAEPATTSAAELFSGPVSPCRERSGGGGCINIVLCLWGST